MKELNYHLGEQKRAEDELQLLKMGLAATASEEGREKYRKWIARKETEINQIAKSAKFYLQKMNRRHRMYWCIGIVCIVIITLKTLFH